MTRGRNRFGTMGAGLLVALVAITACGGDDDDASSADVNGKAFTATDVEGQSLADGGTLVIAFADGSMSVTGGCNTMNGAYAVTDGKLVADQLASTLMACAQPLMDQDTWVSTFLSSKPSFELDGDELTLSDDSTTITLSAG